LLLIASLTRDRAKVGNTNLLFNAVIEFGSVIISV